MATEMYVALKSHGSQIIENIMMILKRECQRRKRKSSRSVPRYRGIPRTIYTYYIIFVLHASPNEGKRRKENHVNLILALINEARNTEHPSRLRRRHRRDNQIIERLEDRRLPILREDLREQDGEIRTRVGGDCNPPPIGRRNERISRLM